MTELELLKRGTKIVMNGELGEITEVRQFASAGVTVSCPYRVRLASGLSRWVGREDFEVIQPGTKEG